MAKALPFKLERALDLPKGGGESHLPGWVCPCVGHRDGGLQGHREGGRARAWGREREGCRGTGREGCRAVPWHGSPLTLAPNTHFQCTFHNLKSGVLWNVGLDPTRSWSCDSGQLVNLSASVSHL